MGVRLQGAAKAAAWETHGGSRGSADQSVRL